MLKISNEIAQFGGVVLRGGHNKAVGMEFNFKKATTSLRYVAVTFDFLIGNLLNIIVSYF